MDSNKDGNPVEKDDVQNGSEVNKPVAPLPETNQNPGSGNSEGTLERSNASKDGDNLQSEDSEGVADLNLGKDSSGVDDNFKPYVDHFQTKQQQERDKVITKILTEYASSYAKKGQVKEQCQKFMLFICCVFVMISVFGVLGLTCRVGYCAGEYFRFECTCCFCNSFCRLCVIGIWIDNGYYQICFS